jgi:uncharacterized protein YkwD
MHFDPLISRRRLLSTGGLLLISPVLLAPVMGSALAAESAETITAMVNALRKQNGAPPLTADARLEKAALYQAKLMAKAGKIGHNIGWGNTFTGRLRQAGIRGPAAENVASGQPDVAAVLKAWMNSAGHRRNLLDPVFTRYGLSYAVRDEKPNYRYWAMLYGIDVG